MSEKEEKVVRTEQGYEIIEEESQSNWSLLKYFKSIGRYKWWLIGLSVAGALVGYLGFKFILNPMRKTLSASYTYNLAGQTDTDGTTRFLDGTLFNYHDLTSKEYLQKVKDSDQKYAKINVNKISEKNSITVTKNVTAYKDTDLFDVTYSISAKASTFPSDAIGQQFLFDLVNFPVELSNTAINKYQLHSVFTEEFSTIPFNKQIDYLRSQFNTVTNGFNNLAGTFGNNSIATEEGTRLYELQNDFNIRYVTTSISMFDLLDGSMYTNRFVNYEEGKEANKISEIRNEVASYKEQIKETRKQLAIAEDSLNTLVTSTTINNGDTSYVQTVVSLNNQITNYKKNIESLNRLLEFNGFYDDGTGNYEDRTATDLECAIYKLTNKPEEWVSANKGFKSQINTLKGYLITDSDVVTDATKYCYRTYQNKVVVTSGYVNLTGSMSSAIGAAVGLVVVFLLASLVTACIYIYHDEPKEKEKEEVK